MLVFINALADPVLPAIDSPLLALGEMAVVRRHVFLFTVLHASLALLQVGRLLRVQFPALDAVANALLLSALAAVYFRTWPAQSLFHSSIKQQLALLQLIFQALAVPDS